MFVGVVQAIDLEPDADGDVAGGSMTLLNRKILIRGPLMPIGLERKALKVGKPLLIVAIANGADLVAALILPGNTIPLIAP